MTVFLESLIVKIQLQKVSSFGFMVNKYDELQYHCKLAVIEFSSVPFSRTQTVSSLVIVKKHFLQFTAFRLKQDT